jgi:ankyrin repeat protein
MVELQNIVNQSWRYWYALLLGKLDEYGPTLFQEAAYLGHIGTVRAYLEQGKPIEEAGVIGMSVLCAAIYGGQAEVAALLLEHGARTKGRDIAKALGYARAHGYSDVVQLLREARK